MTDNEIIKALECCSQEDMCQSCPYGAACLDEKYVSVLSKDALDLINRQKAEIERLKEEIHKGHIAFQKRGDFYRKEIKSAKSEAIKEFAERVSGTITIKGRQKDYFDDLVKETTGSEQL